jgi:hypothetical protein
MDLRNASAVAQVMRHRMGHCGVRRGSGGEHDGAAEATSCTSRRQLLRMGLASAAIGVVGGGAMEFAMARPAFAQSKLSPEAALQALMDGNKRFVERRLTFY